jgi:ferredoxin
MSLKGDGNVYRRLGEKIDSLTVKAPWNETWHSILKELYTAEEADVVAKMPYTLSSLDRIARVTRVEKRQLQPILERLCKKGLVLDLWNKKDRQYYYLSCPLVIGIFEFTMMRKSGHLNTGHWAELFHKYFANVYEANFSNDEKMSVLRVIPIEETIKTGFQTQFLDYERATSLIESADKLAMGICSCRNEKLHIGEKKCDAPLDNCSMLGIGADYMIRNNLAREVSKSEMLENFARSKELGLVLSAANTTRIPIAICHCCKCCCNFLAGLSKFGYVNCVTTSNFISNIDVTLCVGCGKCEDKCPLNAIGLISADDPKNLKAKKGLVDTKLCAGCGVCVSVCSKDAIELMPRESRVIYPESLFEMTMLACLERGTLQNQIFDNPQSITQQFMRVFVGAFLKLQPVKKTLMSNMLRSTFLDVAKGIARMQGKGWIIEL